MTKYYLIILISFASSLNAGVIKSQAQYFKEIGKAESFKWAPSSYQSSFKYDVLYYIPKSAEKITNPKSLIFLHGGGKSTMTQEGSLKETQKYFQSLIRVADKLKTIVVLPSGSGLNWGGHTNDYLRNLTMLMRKELELDHNNIGLAGHSMGGMGIGRSFPWLADEFAYFFPISSGIDPVHQTEENLNKVFNVPYVHLQGINDKFTDFIKRCELQFLNTVILEKKYQQKSKFKLLVYDGPHDYKQVDFIAVLEDLQKTPRNIFQKKLYASFYHANKFNVENNIRFHRGPRSRYFWIEALPAKGANERLDLIAEVRDNRIDLTISEVPRNIPGLRLNLSKKMFNPNQEIEVFANDQLIIRRMMKNSPRQGRYDPTFKFDDSIELLFRR